MSINMFNVRLLHTTWPRLLPRQPGKRSNPGAAYQLRTIDADIEHITEDFADMESDFMQVHKSHRQHEREMQQQREQTRLWVVKQKYFKEKLPNFLTYAEKEQMRLLHARNAAEWSTEKLAQSFPATPQLVQKILRGEWRPRSAKRVLQHDEAVVRNWETFRNGGYPELSTALREHLTKFSERTRGDLMQRSSEELQWQPRPPLPKPAGDQFVSIITSCKRYEERPPAAKQDLLKPGKSQSSSNATPVSSPNDAEDTYLLDKVRDKRNMRLQELKDSKLSTTDLRASRVDAAATDSLSLEQRAVAAFGNPTGTGVLPKYLEPTQNRTGKAASAFNSSLTSKFESTEIVISAEDRKRYEMTAVKERIHIPRKLWRKGGTFKVQDCYYDDDGEFLYRVPGMTGTGYK